MTDKTLQDLLKLDLSDYAIAPYNVTSDKAPEQKNVLLSEKLRASTIGAQWKTPTIDTLTTLRERTPTAVEDFAWSTVTNTIDAIRNIAPAAAIEAITNPGGFALGTTAATVGMKAGAGLGSAVTSAFWKKALGSLGAIVGGSATAGIAGVAADVKAAEAPEFNPAFQQKMLKELEAKYAKDEITDEEYRTTKAQYLEFIKKTQDIFKQNAVNKDAKNEIVDLLEGREYPEGRIVESVLKWGADKIVDRKDLRAMQMEQRGMNPNGIANTAGAIIGNMVPLYASSYIYRNALTRPRFKTIKGVYNVDTGAEKVVQTPTNLTRQQVIDKTEKVAKGITFAQMAGQYETENILDYIERTGDKDLAYYNPSTTQGAMAAAYGAVGTMTEYELGGIEPLIAGSFKKVGIKLPVFKATLKTAGQEVLEEEFQTLEEFLMRNIDDTNKMTWGELLSKMVNSAAWAAPMGGLLGGATFHAARRNLVKGIMTYGQGQINETQAKQIADAIIETAEETIDYKKNGRLEKIRSLVSAMYEDADIPEAEKEDVIDATTALEYSMITQWNTINGTNIDDDPLFKGEVNELGYFRTGIPEDRRADIEAYLAEIRDTQKELENTKEELKNARADEKSTAESIKALADKIDELENRIEILRSDEYKLQKIGELEAEDKKIIRAEMARREAQLKELQLAQKIKEKAEREEKKKADEEARAAIREANRAIAQQKAEAEQKRKTLVRHATTESLRNALRGRPQWDDATIERMTRTELRDAVLTIKDIDTSILEQKSVLEITQEQTKKEEKGKTAKKFFHKRINKQFAADSGIREAWGYSAKDPAQNFVFVKEGGIKDWNEIVQALQADGYMPNTYETTAEATAAQEEIAKDIVLNNRNLDEQAETLAEELDYLAIQGWNILEANGYSQEKLRSMSVQQIREALNKLSPKTQEDIEIDETVPDLPLWQKAYISGKTYYMRPSTKYVLRGGEGQIVHGWGLYFLADQVTNKRRYREGQFANKFVYVPQMPKLAEPDRITLPDGYTGTSIPRLAKNLTDQENIKLHEQLQLMGAGQLADYVAKAKPFEKVDSFFRQIRAILLIDVNSDLWPKASKAYDFMTTVSLGNKADRVDKTYPDITNYKTQLPQVLQNVIDQALRMFNTSIDRVTVGQIQSAFEEYTKKHNIADEYLTPEVMDTIAKDQTDEYKKELKSQILKAMAGENPLWQPFDNSIFAESGAQAIDFKQISTQIMVERLKDTIDGEGRIAVDDVIIANPEIYGGYLGLVAVANQTAFTEVKDLMENISEGKTTLENIEEDKNFQYIKKLTTLHVKIADIANPVNSYFGQIIDSAKEIYNSKKFKDSHKNDSAETKTWEALSQAMRNMTQKQIDTLGLLAFTNWNVPEKDLELLVEILQNPQNIKKTRAQQLELQVPENDVLLDEDERLIDQASAPLIRPIIMDFSFDFGKTLIDNARTANWKLFAEENNIPEKDIVEFVERLFEEHMESFDQKPTKERELFVDFIMQNMTGDKLYMAIADIIPDTYIELESGEEIGDVKEYDGKNYNVEGMWMPAELARDVALFLNDQGIKGMTYKGGIDGRGYVMFSDEALQVLQRLDDDLPIYYQHRKTGAAPATYRGAYIPFYRFILRANKMDASTLSHELAHDWFEQYISFAQTDKASKEFKKQWAEIEKALGIDPDNRATIRSGSETFARAYEAWIVNKKDWDKNLALTDPEKDEMTKLFQRYQTHLKDIYENVTNPYFKRTWGKVGELKPELAAWFDKVTETTDIDAQLRQGTITPAQATQRRIEDQINTAVEAGRLSEDTRQVIKNVQTLNDTSRYEVEGGNKNAIQNRLAQLARNIDENNMAVNKQYDTRRDMLAVAEAADNFVRTRTDEALDIINGRAPETEGLFATDLYTALERLANETNDLALVEQLSESDIAKRLAKELGQRVVGFRNFLADGRIDTVSALRTLSLKFENALTQKGESQLTDAENSFTEEIKTQDDIATKNIDAFLQELECK